MTDEEFLSMLKHRECCRYLNDTLLPMSQVEIAYRKMRWLTPIERRALLTGVNANAYFYIKYLDDKYRLITSL